MPRDGFYNDNEYREYPFLFKPTYSADDLPNAAIVDCGFIVGLDSAFNTEIHSIYLQSIERQGTDFLFTFFTNTPNSISFPLTFTVDQDAPEWTEVFASSAVNNTAGFCATEPVWEGFIVIGTLTELKQAIAVGDSVFFGDQREVEPARIQSLVKSYLRSVSVGNYARVVALPVNCAEPTTAVTLNTRQIVVNAQCLAGNIFFKPGFNCQISQNDAANVLTIAASLGANTSGPDAAEFCANGSEIKLTPTEQAATGSKFLSGGPACDEVISAINGLSSANINIVGGSGIQIVTTATPNTLSIQLDAQLLSSQC